MGLTRRRDEDVNVSSEKEKMMENLCIAHRHAGMSTFLYVDMFISGRGLSVRLFCLKVKDEIRIVNLIFLMFFLLFTVVK